MRRSNAPKVNPSLDEKEGMDPIRTPFRSARSGFRPPSSTKHSDARLKSCLYISISVGLLLFCYILLVGDKNQGKKRYSVVIDGGSTGTRIHVFEYEIRDGILVVDFSGKGSASMKVNPGLSAYASQPDRAGGSLEELMEFAKRNVPAEKWSETEVHLMATAGMRLLEVEHQERILNVCRKILRASGFRFRDDWASVISGADEGLYAWVVANYARGTLGKDPSQTTGIIELGGASAQVAFISNEPLPPEFSHKIKFGNFTYNLYSHSLLHFGLNVAYDLLKESLVHGYQESASGSVQTGMPLDPCTPAGYTPNKEARDISAEKSKYPSSLIPRGNFSECRSASLKMLKKGKDKCSYHTCHIGSTFIPKLRGKFLATENFFHTSKFFGLSQRAFLSHLMVAGQQFCAEDWSKLTQKYASFKEEDFIHYCFSSAYIVALLHDSLGIALKDQRIEYANEVNNIPLDWAVGAFILQASTELDPTPDQYSDWSPRTSLIWGKYTPWLLVFIIFLTILLTSLLVSKWRKPHLKTIYDVQKGKYIVARVNRYP